jgi:uncharacterized protein (TIGR02265 family)
MERELVYDMGVESLFRGIGDRLTPKLKQTVRELGIDLDKKLLPAYPKEVWVQVVDAVARSVSPDVELAIARRELGHAISRGFKDSVMGRLIAPGLRLMGVRRIMMRLPKNLTISNNFMRVNVAENGPRGIRLEVNEAVPSEEFLCGVIEEIASYAGAKNCEIFTAKENGRVVFSVNWTE